jgi:hypothetical protein
MAWLTYIYSIRCNKTSIACKSFDSMGGIGNLIEGLTVFELKDENVMRRVGIGVCHRRLAAPDAASSSNSLAIGPLMPA